MIVTDLDDTLLRGDKTISEYTIAVLKQCQSRGIKVMFATARSRQAAARSLDQFMPDIFAGYGGALVSAGEDVIYRFDILADVSARLIRVMLETPEISCVHAINETAALTNRPNMMDAESSHYQYSDFSDTSLSYLKISVLADHPAAVENIAKLFPMCDMLRYSGEDLYRFANRDAVKWNAVKAAAEYYHIHTGDVAAFGDDVNDLEMLEKCGAGVAVENAIGPVKAVARHTCDSNDHDGVAKWIEGHILRLRED